MRIKIAFSVCGVALALGITQARADGLTTGGTIIGVFSDPIYSGFVTHDPTISSPPAYFDNTATAPLSLSIVNSTDPTLAGTPPLQATGSKLQWGSDLSVDPSEQFSELIFFGAQIPADIHQPFEAGVITFLNGTSNLNSLIFGASLSLYDNVSEPAELSRNRSDYHYDDQQPRRGPGPRRRLHQHLRQWEQYLRQLNRGV